MGFHGAQHECDNLQKANSLIQAGMPKHIINAVIRQWNLQGSGVYITYNQANGRIIYSLHKIQHQSRMESYDYYQITRSDAVIVLTIYVHKLDTALALINYGHLLDASDAYYMSMYDNQWSLYGEHGLIIGGKI